MKKYLRIILYLIVVLLLMFSVTGCTSEEAYYDDGYNEGYTDGYYIGYDDGHSDGYGDGYDEAYDELKWQVYDSVYEAEHYASENGGWHPEEARGIIEDYPNDPDISKKDYENAIHSLISFYEYFYSGKYED